MEKDGAMPTISPELAERPRPEPTDSPADLVLDWLAVLAVDWVLLALVVSAVEWVLLALVVSAVELVTEPDSPQDSDWDCDVPVLFVTP